jgi:chromosome segregation ATPase
MLLGDLAAQREQLQHMHNLSVSAPVLAIDPVGLPIVVDAKRRATKARITELEQVAERNLRAAQEARAAVAFQQERLEEETSARMKAEFRINTLNREVEQLRDEDGQQKGQIKAHALLQARETVASELSDLNSENDMLRTALSDHDELLVEYRERLKSEQETRLALAAELESGKRRRRRSASDTTDADHDAEVALLGKEIDALTARLEAQKTSALAEVDAANARVNELNIKLDAAELKAREADRLARELETIATRFESAKDGAAIDLGRANERVGELETALHEACDERAELLAKIKESNQALQAASNERAALVAQVEESQQAVKAGKAGEGAKGQRVHELERALNEAIEERTELIAKIEASQKALQAAQKSSAPASATDAGEKGQMAADLELARAEAEELRAKVEAATVEIEKLRKAASTPPPEGMRRTAMAELSAIAGAPRSDDLMPRRH